MFDSDQDNQKIFQKENEKQLFPRKQQPYFTKYPQIQHFERKRFIASGAFGQVQLYYSPQKKQLFALKRMKFDGKDDLKNIKQIKRQLQMLYKINSPYLVKLHDHFQDEKSVYLIMQYVEGNTLAESIFHPKIQLQMNPICKIIYEICEGLEQLHKLKIVHRDLKLENIILTKGSKGSIKIIDLGESNHYGEGISRQTKRGTKSYFCPEILNRQQQDDRVDSWCLGIIIYELICMSSPFFDSNQPIMEQKIRRFNYKIPQRIKFQKQLLDLFSKIFTYKIQRLRITDIKNHPWIKKYLNQDNHLFVRFQNIFPEKEIHTYRSFLEGEIQRYKNSYMSALEQNIKLEEMLELTEKKIFGLKQET